MDKIMVAVDGSGYARKAIAMAAKLANACDAELTLLYVDTPGPFTGEVADFAQTEDLARGDVIDWIFESAEREARSAGAPTITREVGSGEAAEGVLRAVEEQKPDLLVMGARGLSDLEGLVFGSVSHKVLHLSTVPCLIAR